LGSVTFDSFDPLFSLAAGLLIAHRSVL
jgi:hypothetical protein